MVMEDINSKGNVKMLKGLYYTILKFFTQWGDELETAAIKATVILSLLLFLNLFIIVDLASLVFNLSFFSAWNGGASLKVTIGIVLIVIFVLNYVFFMGKDQFVDIESNFSRQSTSFKFIRIFLVLIYVFLTVGLALWIPHLRSVL